MTNEELDKHWILNIRKGDVLQSRSGDLRVVRNVKQSHTVSKVYVTFAIRHCSWTHRAYTIYTGCDLRTMKFRPTGHYIDLRKKIDKQMEHDFQQNDRKNCILDCCAVKSVP
jgi:hypothetical protein